MSEHIHQVNMSSALPPMIIVFAHVTLVEIEQVPMSFDMGWPKHMPVEQSSLFKALEYLVSHLLCIRRKASHFAACKCLEIFIIKVEV